ncbi:Histidine phosphatase superfamily [compost metagenome]
MPNEIVDERYPGLYFSALRMDERYPGGESPLEFYTRIKAAFKQICLEQHEREQSENLLIVTHGGVINVIYHLVRGLEWSNRPKAFSSSYTSVHKVSQVSGKWEIEADYQGIRI